jgi:hypothetical protein
MHGCLHYRNHARHANLLKLQPGLESQGIAAGGAARLPTKTVEARLF